MKIDFNTIQESVHPNFKGGEKELAARMYFDGKNRIMKARLESGASIGMHVHDSSCEVMIITGGICHVIYDGQRIDLVEGDIHYCPKGHGHSLVNSSEGPVEFIGIVPEQ